MPRTDLISVAQHVEVVPVYLHEDLVQDILFPSLVQYVLSVVTANKASVGGGELLMSHFMLILF